MNPIPIHASRSERYGLTQKKTITLTEDGIEAIQQYADRHGLYFSVAIESLALKGLGHTTAESLPRLVGNVLERVLTNQYNRFAKLLSLAAMAAEEANYKTDILLLQTIWREARADPDRFLETLQVSLDPHARPDAQVREIRDRMSADAHEAAVTRLKKPLSQMTNLLPKEGDDG